jgi:hypothetical protein
MAIRISTENFAAADSDRIAGLLDEKVHDWVKYTQATATYLRMRDSWKMYYGLTKEGLHTTSQIREVGPQGEYSLLTCNHYRSLLQHLHVMTTAQRPALECRAANTDAQSMEQCQLGNALLEWYMGEKKVERFLKTNVEYALFLSEGFLSMDWEPTLGNMYAMDPESGQPLYEGDIEFRNYTPLDVCRDPFRNDSRLPWAIVVRWKNRFDLASQYPDKSDRILSVKPEMLWKLREDFFNRLWYAESDLIPEMTFYHERCPSLPQGRIVKFLSKDNLLLDSPLPYSKIPVFRTACADQADTPYGYTPAFDLMGPQMAMHVLDSIILTNQKTHGLGVIVIPEGNNIEYTQLAEGLCTVTVNEKNGQLRAVNFTNTPKEIFEFRNMMKSDMQELSAVNSVVRGNPESNVTSGAFAALLASQALQFNSGLEQSYAETCEDVGGMIIEMLQKFGNTERVGKIVGKDNQYMMKSFTGSDLDSIKRVFVEITNPLSKTTAGKMKMAEDLMQMGQIKRPDQYKSVMNTGKLEPIYQNEQTSLNNIRRENEMLTQGQKPTALITDDHKCHILEHLVIMDDPSKRSDPRFTGPCLEHTLEHITMGKQCDPGFMQWLGRMPLVMANPMSQGFGQPPQPQVPQGMPMGPQGQAPQPMGGATQPQPNPQAQPGNMPSQIMKSNPQMPLNQARMPNMPMNPQTGTRFEPALGPISESSLNLNPKKK